MKREETDFLIVTTYSTLTRRSENQSHIVFSAVLQYPVNQSGETCGIKV